MCGIAGVLLGEKIKNKELKTLEFAVAKMNKLQASRGPDDEDVITFERGVFGHRRLSILDLSKKGHQPMTYKNQKTKIKNQNDLLITFNGEIYNFLELRSDLEKRGYKFKTKTDTEVILALYAEYGEKSFEMLRGMFAFGLWDEGNKKLFLVKDRYGIKPLYYYSDGEKSIFASTVKAISESGLIRVEKNPNALIGFLLFGSVPLPLTTIKNVLAVPAGHYLAVGHDGAEKLVKYYNPLDYYLHESVSYPYESVLKDNNTEIISKVRQLLIGSVNAHLISDAPLGVFLSGGLDSSAIAALSAEALREGGAKNKITTLSIIFDEKEFSEKKYQKMVADKIKSDHREIKITKNDFENSFEQIFEAMDQPTIDGVNSFFIAGAAKKAGLKAVLSGMGSDEIFLGYSHFKKAGSLRFVQKIAGLSLPQFLKHLNFLIATPQSWRNSRYAKAEYFSNRDILSFYLGFRGLFTPWEAAKVLGANLKEINEFLNSIIANYQLSNIQLTRLHPANLLSYLETKFYLQNQLLKDTDFMSMYHSVEVRVPFLDHPLVEYLSSLPPKLKFQHLNTETLKNANKPLLVGAVQNLLPQEIFTRPKMGFTFPFQKWLGDPQNANYHWSREWAKSVFNKFK